MRLKLNLEGKIEISQVGKDNEGYSRQELSMHQDKQLIVKILPQINFEEISILNFASRGNVSYLQNDKSDVLFVAE